MKNAPHTEKPLDAITDHKTRFYWNRVQEHGKRFPDFEWPSVESVLNLIYTYEMLMSHFSKRIARYGLSPSAFNILMILSRSESKCCKQSELSRLILVSRANITGLMDSLVRKGLVTRKTNPHDRRICLARITEAGESFLENFLPSHYLEIKKTTASLSVKEKKVLTRLLTQIRKNFFKNEKNLPR